MRPLEAYESLMAFAAERGAEALHLALHASLPQSFRPDFLHLLRLNFLPDLSPGTEADVLLAPFCEDTGGYYQFDPEVRRLLLSQLDPTFPEEKGERLRRVARLLVSYIGHQGTSLSPEQDRLSEDYHSIQAWVALAFLHPDQAAMQLAAALEQGLRENETAARVQFSGLAGALSVPLVQYPKLLTYAAGLEALEQGRTEEAADLLKHLPDEEIRIGSVTLRSPRMVMRNQETQRASHPAEVVNYSRVAAFVADPKGRQVIQEIIEEILVEVEPAELDLSPVFIESLLDAAVRGETVRLDTDEEAGRFGQGDWMFVVIVPLVVQAMERLLDQLAGLGPADSVGADDAAAAAVSANEVRKLVRFVGSRRARTQVDALIQALRRSLASRAGNLRTMNE
jgi:hypothetical protein